MTFGPWYPLEQAGEQTPAAPGVFQVRLAGGLIDYPSGKSAMVHYGWSETDLRAAVLAFAATAAAGLLCRHVEEMYPRAAHDRLREQFIRRFGSPPRSP